MKKILTSLCLIALTTGSLFSQSFSLTPAGFVDPVDPTKDYLVIDIPGTQSEIYDKAKNYLMTIYSSPKDVLSESKPDVITINGILSNAVIQKKIGMVIASYDMNYTISIRFKDGKIRIDNPSFTLSSYEDGSKPMKMILKGSSNGGLGSEVINVIYDKKDKLKAQYAKEQLESFFNSYINALKNGMESEPIDW